MRKLSLAFRSRANFRVSSWAAPVFSSTLTTSGLRFNSGAGEGGKGVRPPSGPVGEGFDLNKYLNEINKDDLKLGDDMPPMLQYNQELVDAGLALLESSSEMELDAAEEAALTLATELLFKETLVPFTEQFKIVTAVLDHPRLRENPRIRDAVRVIIDTIVPKPIFEAWTVVDRDQLTEEENKVFLDFIVIVLKGEAEEEAFISALKALQTEVPWLFKLEKWLDVLRKLKETMMQCRLSYLILETCRAFDEEGTGKVKLAELQEALSKVIGPEGAKSMLEGAEAEDDGTVFYPQLARILMKGARFDGFSEGPGEETPKSDSPN
jgi:hypothetical protein